MMSFSSKILHLVRHGQALHNVRAEAARSAGCSFDEFLQLMREDDAVDADLTPIGVQQAEAVRDDTTARPQLVVASPLSRALQTADIIFGAGATAPRSPPPFVCLETFRERNGLLLNGMRRPASFLRERFGAVDFDDIAPGDEDAAWHEWGDKRLENAPTCAKRAYAGLQWIAARPEEDIALVAHGGLFDAMTNHLPELIASDDGTSERFHNCELRTVRLSWDGDVARLEKLIDDE